MDRLVSEIRAAILNARLYPPSSPVISDNLNTIEQLVGVCLTKCADLCFNEIEGKLYVNMAPVAKNELRAFFAAHEIQGVTLSPGVSREDLSKLMVGLGMNKNKFPAGETLHTWLQSQGAGHVNVQEFQFVAVRKGEDVSRQVRLLFGQKHEGIESVLATLQRSVRLLDEVSEGADQDAVMRQMIQEITTLSAPLLQSFFSQPIPERLEQEDFKGKVLASLSREKITEVLESTGGSVQEIYSSSFSVQETERHLGGLRQFVESLAKTAAASQVDPELFANATAMLQSRTAGPAGGDGVSVESRILELLDRPSAALLEPSLAKSWPALLNLVAGMKEESLAERLVVKVSENLAAPEAVRREAAVQWLRQCIEILAAHKMEKPMSLAVQRLMDLAKVEMEPVLYGQITEALQIGATEDVLRSRFESCSRALLLLRQHAFSDTSPSPRHAPLAQRSLEIFSQRNLNALASDAISGESERLLGAEKILAILGEESVESLLVIYEQTENPRLLQFAIQNLRRFSARMREGLTRRLTPTAPDEAALHLLRLLALMAEEDRAALLPPLLAHPSAAVRRETARMLPSIKNRSATADLLTLLEDSDTQVQVQAMRLLQEKCDLAALPEILRKAKAGSPALQEVICLAMGDWKDARALPVLADLLDVPDWPWQKIQGIPDSVKQKAAWALGQYLPNPQAEKVLKKAMRAGPSAVSLAARSALARAALVAR